MKKFDATGNRRHRGFRNDQVQIVNVYLKTLERLLEEKGAQCQREMERAGNFNPLLCVSREEYSNAVKKEAAAAQQKRYWLLRPAGPGLYKGYGTFDTMTGEIHLLNPQLEMWDHSLNSTPLYRSYPRESVCSQPCAETQYPVYKKNLCCWSCNNCSLTEILKEDRSGCEKCQLFYWPTENKTLCYLLPETILDPSSDFLLIMALIGAVVGIITTCTLTIFFLKKKSHSLEFTLLVGVMFLFVSVALSVFIAPATCEVSHFLLAIGFAIVFSAFIAKLIHAKSGANRKQQAFLIAISVLTQVIILMFVGNIPTVIRQQTEPSLPFVERTCSRTLKSSLAASAFNIFLMLLYMAMSLATRKSRHNFRDGKRCLFTIYTSCILWLIYVPSYAVISNAYYMAIFQIFGVLIVAFVALVANFIGKMK